MIVHTRSVRFLVILCTMHCVVKRGRGAQSAEGVKDEDDMLKEALLLVRLLRSEHEALKTPRSGYALAALRGITAPRAPLPPSQVSTFNTTIHSISKTQYNGTLSTRSGFRRAMSHEKYQRGPYRRQIDYEDPFGAHPAETSKIVSTAAASDTLAPSSPQADSTAAASTVSAKSTTVTSTKPAKKPGKATTPSIKGTTKKLAKLQKQKLKGTVATRPQIVKLNGETIVQLNENDNAPVAAEHNDPVMAQVHTELKNEMKGIPGGNKAWPKNIDELLKAQTKSTKSPTTVRVHLEGSSRLPLPLGENHAFCFTNPTNGLCRAPI